MRLLATSPNVAIPGPYPYEKKYFAYLWRWSRLLERRDKSEWWTYIDLSLADVRVDEVAHGAATLVLGPHARPGRPDVQADVRRRLGRVLAACHRPGACRSRRSRGGRPVLRREAPGHAADRSRTSSHPTCGCWSSSAIPGTCTSRFWPSTPSARARAGRSSRRRGRPRGNRRRSASIASSTGSAPACAGSPRSRAPGPSRSSVTRTSSPTSRGRRGGSRTGSRSGSIPTRPRATRSCASCT